jgi:hypothetical protein
VVGFDKTVADVRHTLDDAALTRYSSLARLNAILSRHFVSSTQILFWGNRTSARTCHAPMLLNAALRSDIAAYTLLICAATPVFPRQHHP